MEVALEQGDDDLVGDAGDDLVVVSFGNGVRKGHLAVDVVRHVFWVGLRVGEESVGADEVGGVLPGVGVAWGVAEEEMDAEWVLDGVSDGYMLDDPVALRHM